MMVIDICLQEEDAIFFLKVRSFSHPCFLFMTVNIKLKKRMISFLSNLLKMVKFLHEI